MLSYLLNYNLRPSCYHCTFSNGNDGCDLSLGDFWQIEDFFPELDDDKGVSIVRTYSKKGSNYLKKISDDFIIQDVQNQFKNVIQDNKSNIQKIPEKRGYFFKLLEKKSLDIALRKATKRSVWKRIKSRVGMIILGGIL